MEKLVLCSKIFQDIRIIEIKKENEKFKKENEKLKKENKKLKNNDIPKYEKEWLKNQNILLSFNNY